MDRHPSLAVGAPPEQMLPEETVNSVTHGIGLLMSIPGAVGLLIAAWLYGNVWHLVGCGVYAATLVGVYAASTLSHFLQGRDLKRLFRVLDQAFIYLLIAGTYTPFALGYLRAGWWWLLSGLVWGIALAGFFSKTVWRHRIDRIAIWTYVGLGWLPAIAITRVLQLAPVGVFWWLIVGGFCYTIGIVFLKLDARVRYFHATWHVVVIAGSICHYVAILLYVMPVQL